MVRQIIWSRRAQSDRKSIYKYWNSRNKSKTYSKKLNRLFNKAVEFVADYPTTGRPTVRKNIRVKLVGHFAIIYKSSQIELFVLAIYDTRQNPRKLKKIMDD